MLFITGGNAPAPSIRSHHEIDTKRVVLRQIRVFFEPHCKRPLFATAMPVPKRRQSQSLSIQKLPGLLVKCCDINFVFQKTRIFLLYGFAPAVIAVGLTTEPRPSLWDLFNIWE